MNRSARLVALVAALAVVQACGLARAQSSSEVELRHQAAETLLPVLRSLAAPAVLAGSGATLRIQGSGAELARATQLVAQSDHEPGRLSVLMRDDLLAGDEPAAGELQPQDNSTTLSTGTAPAPDRQGNGQVLGTSPAPRREGIVEGEPLRVSMPATQSLRFRVAPPARSVAAGRAAAANAGGVVHFETLSDFTLRLWRVGSTVAVQVQGRRAGRVSGSASREGADEQEPGKQVVYGPIGRWFALADSGRPIGPEHAGEPRTGLWIRVEPVAE
jgi:hypothetical protein